MTARRRRLIGLAVALAATTTLAACGGEAPPVSEPSAGDPAGQPEPAAGVEPAPELPAPEEMRDGATITVLDLGTQPRTELRFQPKIGATQRTVMTMSMKMTLYVDDDPLPSVDIPPIATVIAATVTGVTEEEIAAEFVYEDVDVIDDGLYHPTIVEEMRAGIASLTGFGGEFAMTSRGELVTSALTGDAFDDPLIGPYLEDLSAQLESLMVPLPADPVGVGARWVVATRTGLGGIETTLEVTYELIDRDGDRVTLAASYNQDAEPQTIRDEATAGEVEVESLIGGGSGQVTMTLSSLLPDSAEMSTRGTMRGSVVEGGERFGLRQLIRMELILRPQ